MTLPLSAKRAGATGITAAALAKLGLRESVDEGLVTEDEADDLMSAIVSDIARQIHPLAPAPIGFEYARLLACQLARIGSESAHVVMLCGAYHICAEGDLDAGMWPRDAIVYTADAAHVGAF